MEIIQLFTELPHIIEFEGISAELQLLRTSENENKLIYNITNVERTSKHFDSWTYGGFIDNPFHKNSHTGFLLLYEGIENNKDLETAIAYTWQLLIKHNIAKN